MVLGGSSITPRRTWYGLSSCRWPTFSGPVSHAGFIAASIALIATNVRIILCLAIHPAFRFNGVDLIWLSAILLQALELGAAAVYVRWRFKVGA